MRNLPCAVILCVLLTSPAHAARVILNVPTDGHAVILVHGWGRSPRKPNSIWKAQIEPYTDLTTLKGRFHGLGFKEVYEAKYDDLQNLDQMASTVATQIRQIIKSSRNPNLRLDVVEIGRAHV